MHCPPVLFIVHPRERRSKCSIEPLRGRDGFEFRKFPEREPPALDGYVRLGFGGPLLSPADREAGLLVLDATWNYAVKMEPDYRHVPVRSLLPWTTAYPRTSKLYDDPTGGLATIEAVFAAFLQMGRDPTGLLDTYRWRDEFLTLNNELIDRCQRGDIAP